jgi:hypothetical protein
MLKSISLLACLFVVITGFTRSSQSPDRVHDQWLLERYSEAISIKEGMTRADLLKLFRTDGGLQSFLPTRYVLKRSNLVKVDVDFDVPAGVNGKIVPEDLRFEMQNAGDVHFVSNDKLKIKRISKPYVEPSDSD